MALVVGKTMLRTFFCTLLHVAALIYAQDDQSGFISIDCGSKLNYTKDHINFVTDDGFIEGGENQILAVHDYTSPINYTFRIFPENKRNCYTLRPQKGKNNRYLIRAGFYYGSDRGQPPQFDLYIGADFWVTVSSADGDINIFHEMIHLTSSDYIHVCLVNTNQGLPFISSLQLRLLDINMYNDPQSRSLLLESRTTFGTTDKLSYPDDKYDRKWYPSGTGADVRAVHASNTVSLKSFGDEQVPLKVMSTAITPINSTEIKGSWNTMNNYQYLMYFHIAEVEILESNQKREFSIKINNTNIGTFSASTDTTTIDVYPVGSENEYLLSQTTLSTLPPILNALEIYTLKQFQQNQTDDQDAAAIWSTKSTYGLLKQNWQGDPCVPKEYVWIGLNCSYSTPRAARIMSLNLSSRGLSGGIAAALANLTMLESLDMSYNNLTGNVPKFLAGLDNLRILNLMGNNFTGPLPQELLAKSKKGLWLSIEGNTTSVEHKRSWMHIIVVILVPIIACIVVISIVIIFIVKQRKRKALIKREGVFKPKKHQFTYPEVIRITNNFQNEIGRGGFGRVFRGSIEDNQVAVKILSESSSQGYKEFQAEVKLLMEVRHTNITSLVGYCDDNNHKGIIYDFMANGSLEKHLFDGCPNLLSWEKRIQIGCDVAEGLAYMHHGCRPPIVHRDVKSSNILLNEGFQAKLADLGLSRAYPTEDASHASSLKVAGTIGYLDPEYHSTGRLTEKSDVYSFGVVLMELITGRKARSEGINIVNWVQSLVKEGNAEVIIDSRLEGCFDINTAWKVIETAIACVSYTSIKRPTMTDVAMDLKHCVQAEKTRESRSMSLILEDVSDPKPR